MILCKMLSVCFQPDKRPIDTVWLEKTYLNPCVSWAMRLCFEFGQPSNSIQQTFTHLLCFYYTLDMLLVLVGAVYMSQSLFWSSLLSRQKDVYTPNITQISSKKYYHWPTNQGKQAKRVNSIGKINESFRDKMIIDFS